MKNIKLIATDLDATFLNNDREISEYTKEVVQKAIDNGILFIPCSARNRSFLPTWFMEHPKIKYLVTSNGAIIIDNATKEVIHHATIPGKLALQILEEATKVNPYWTVDIGNAQYASNRIVQDHEELSINIKDPKSPFATTRIFIDDYHDVLNENTPVNKMHFVTTKYREEVYDVLKRFKEIDITSSHIINFEIISTSAGKGKALQKIMELEHISKDKAMAFGDNDNDIEMIQAVKYGVAVANAKEALKEVAPYHTLSNEENGVAHFIANNVL